MITPTQTDQTLFANIDGGAHSDAAAANARAGSCAAHSGRTSTGTHADPAASGTRTHASSNAARACQTGAGTDPGAAITSTRAHSGANPTIARRTGTRTYPACTNTPHAGTVTQATERNRIFLDISMYLSFYFAE